MGSAGLDNALILFFQFPEGGNQLIQSRQELILNGDHCCNVHGGGEGVIGGLGHIDVIVGMQQLAADQFIAPVGNDFIHIHIGLGTGAGLPDHQREVVSQFSGNHFIRSGADGCEFLTGHLFRFQGVVCQGGTFFQNAEGMDDFRGHRLPANTDGEILNGALGLGAPVFVGRDFHLTHGVVFNAVIHMVSPYLVFSFDYSTVDIKINME